MSHSHDHAPSDDAMPLALLGLDGFETGLLAVLRHFLTAFTRPETQSWQTAFAIASERWGETTGPQVAAGGLALLQVLRRSRRRAFNYANPMCTGCREQVTGDEAQLMRMLQAMRRDRTDLARPEVLALTEGTMDPALIRTALSFAARHPAEDADFAPLPADRPALRSRGHLRLVH
ncbi:hypothetical protein G5B31_14730 [Rhodobacter sp. SGA-6-6]|uniref:hypothetical protein n=1 Tax=Rhodobacter sp. SGA-6-6 TaxID=2710882 RepID=UPI0013EC7D62|nr:hypothetical protein [Rhodobacter sp. SGA-6-6]NGM46791.1 hypothetical protein [Rhodobacter sp. SGA-6-6]